MLRRGDRIPHFEVTTLAGERFSYGTIWQQRNLLLLLLPAIPDDDEASRTASLNGEASKFDDTAFVVTRDAVDGVRGPAVVVADKWGEVMFAAAAESVSGLPGVSELVEWLEYVRNKCPECEGEAR